MLSLLDILQRKVMRRRKITFTLSRRRHEMTSVSQSTLSFYPFMFHVQCQVISCPLSVYEASWSKMVTLREVGRFSPRQGHQSFGCDYKLKSHLHD